MSGVTFPCDCCGGSVTVMVGSPAAGLCGKCDQMLLPHQKRVVVEHAELFQKIHRLKAFLERPGTTVSAEEMYRMVRQLEVMEQYASILRERIAAFGR